MPTSNKSFLLPIEPNEHKQWKEVAKEQNLALTDFIRQAVREKLQRLGKVPSTYEYKSGAKEGNKNATKNKEK